MVIFHSYLLYFQEKCRFSSSKSVNVSTTLHLSALLSTAQHPTGRRDLPGEGHEQQPCVQHPAAPRGQAQLLAQRPAVEDRSTSPRVEKKRGQPGRFLMKGGEKPGKTARKCMKMGGHHEQMVDEERWEKTLKEW